MSVDEFRYMQANRDSLFGPEDSLKDDQLSSYRLFDPKKFVFPELYHREIDEIGPDFEIWLKKVLNRSDQDSTYFFSSS